VSTERLSAELWSAIRERNWALVAEPLFPSLHEFWEIDKFHQYIGVSGGSGIGYGSPAAIGAALANKKYGRLSVNIQNDGDLMYAPGVLWTAAYHRIPLLMLMHNNRCYHQELMHVQRMAGMHDRPQSTARIGTEITTPNIDFAKVAQGMGVWSEGPITDPAQIGPALQRALAVVKDGHPALIDVVSQPR
jgi:benzoylformate decarboxylase/acetolactate synthase-1/2/3 large subunit